MRVGGGGLKQLLGSVLSLAAAFAAGFAANSLHVPLAWILGPLFVTAAFSIAGAPIFAPIAGRRFGQIAIGASIGLNITGAVALLMLLWLPAMVVTALFAIVLAGALSVPYARLSGTDQKTAYYAMMPGGLSEMANLGAAAGAAAEPIAVSQALRVALLVCTLPPFIIALDIHGTDVSNLSQPVLSHPLAATVVGIGLLGAVAARLCKVNNPWMIGALVAVGTLTASGFLAGRLPSPLFWLGQFLIGISIGARFKRETLLSLPRVVATSTFFVLLMTGLMFGYAWLLARLSGLDLASTTLGSAPGGLAEMAITAQTLHLTVGLVTGFHAVRAILVNGLASHIYRLLDRVRFFAAFEELLPKGRSG